MAKWIMGYDNNSIVVVPCIKRVKKYLESTSTPSIDRILGLLDSPVYNYTGSQIKRACKYAYDEMHKNNTFNFQFKLFVDPFYIRIIVHEDYFELIRKTGKIIPDPVMYPRKKFPKDCYTCKPSFAKLKQSILMQDSIIKLSYDLKDRNLLIITPTVHTHYIHDLCPPDIRHIIDNVQTLNFEFEFIKLNYGSWRNHEHLHLKIDVPKIEMTRYKSQGYINMKKGVGCTVRPKIPPGLNIRVNY